MSKEKSAVDQVFAARKNRQGFHDQGHGIHQEWVSSGHQPEHFDRLLDHYKPVENSAVQKYKGPNTNESAMRDRFRELAHEAARAWSPEKGANLETLMTHYAKGLYRYNTQNNDLVRKPEEIAQHIGPVQKAQEHYFNQFPGQTPTSTDLSRIVQEQTGKKMAPSAVDRAMREMSRREVPSSAFEEDFHARLPQRLEELKPLIPLMTNSPFSEREMDLFKHLEGLDGRSSSTSTGELANRMGLSSSQVSKLRKSLDNKLEDMIRQRNGQ